MQRGAPADRGSNATARLVVLARSPEGRLEGTVQQVDGHASAPYSWTLEFLRMLEDTLQPALELDGHASGEGGVTDTQQEPLW
jgi:hypothetical protein